MCAAHSLAQEWNYRENGPDRWASLDRSFATCGAGDQQSPIDLRDGVKANLPKLSIHMPTDRVAVWNNGHTIQVSSPEGASMDVGGSSFPLSQFHFHSPSEHSIEGKQAAMEVHFVYSHRDSQLTVLGALLGSWPAQCCVLGNHGSCAGEPGRQGTDREPDRRQATLA